MDGLKEACKCNTGAKSPQGVSANLPAPMRVDDKVTTVVSWADRIDLETDEASD